jgi:F-type H+-transporting ATPase subunit b
VHAGPGRLCDRTDLPELTHCPTAPTAPITPTAPTTPTDDARTTIVPLATSNFLVPNGTFIVVLLAFLVVVWVIGKKVLPVLNKALAERQDQIRGELEAADKAKSDAEIADAERRAALEEARAHARDIVSQASAAADQIKLRAESDAQEIHDRIVRAADAEVVIARQAAVEEVTARVGEIVLAAAERVIGREIQAADHRDLIDEAIAAVRDETSGAAAGAARSGR